MGSKAAVSAPSTVFPCSSKKLQFSTVFISRSSSFSSTPITISRVSSNGFGSRVNPIVSQRNKFPLVVKAESSSEGEVVEAIDNAEAEEAANSEVPVAEAESETKPNDAAEAEAQPPRKPRIKLGEIMGILNKRAIEESDKERPTPDIRTGDVVEIKLEVPENRRRLSIYKGIVISKQNAGIHTTIRIRRIIAGIGVEIVFPVYSPNIKEIKVVSHRKVRRARLYYLRDKLPRLSTFK
ncbi:PREDICTED: 50S ribosomal protein L19-2, chloroplastic isoform X2 [Nelumbo nucifera]|uniref:50S ribosomal protein L19-2, chloroplastic isoform X2 n=2 Tax=Nelumbo nucifera TaxID=4432 RepID=A0A1U8BG22_NELNU|nr:PREDICTED: 50S ribosomal protein L19-2, chloroplastic isoform X2 [Nelumbo nucifera]DAD18357.1 TPA_asm: hypothetical protein HUJ06_019820 [Nelumbo nucifera]